MTFDYRALEVIPGVPLAQLDFLIAAMDGTDETDVITLLNNWMLEEIHVS